MLDYLPQTNFKVQQKKEMFRFNTDSVLLGEFLEIPFDNIVLDIGTNNGVLLLYASRFQPKELVGIDIFEEVLELAKENLLSNNVCAKFYATRLQDFSHKEFDTIICNPPYFNTHNESLKNNNLYLKAARHQEFLSLKDLCFHSKRLLKETGSFFMIYPASQCQQVFVECDKVGLAVDKMKLIFDEDTEYASRILFLIKNKPYKDIKIVRPHTISRNRKIQKTQLV